MTLESIEAELSSTDSAISVDTMAIMVDALKRRAASKGRQFNCVVLDRSERPADDELTSFLTQLSQNVSNLPNTRIQAVYNSNGHWSTFDLEIKNGQLNFFLLDAANALPQVLSAMATIHTIIPSANISYSGPEFQKDGRNCAYFALDHAVNLSKIKTLHEQLPACVETGPLGQFANYGEFVNRMIESSSVIKDLPNQAGIISAAKTLHYVPMSKFPKHFGSLIKTTQNLNDYNRFFANKGYERHNKKSLDDYVNSKKVVVHSDNYYIPRTIHSRAITDKKDQLRQLGLTHLQTLGETYVSVLNSRKLIPITTNSNQEQPRAMLSSRLQQRKINIHLKKLRVSIKKMKEHGSNIAKEDETKGLVVTNLADQLERKINEFFNEARSNPLKSNDFNSFKTEFTAMLHSQDELMAKHRKYWKVIVANIAISLTVVGALLIVGNSIWSKKLTLFFEKTQSEEDVMDIDVQFSNIAPPAA